MRWRWTDEGWTVAPAADDAWVVDSFLLDEGFVAAREAHEQRFLTACASESMGITEARLSGFWEAVWRRLPQEGRGFPRVEAHRGDPAALVLWMRLAPPLTEQVRLWVPRAPDPREHPRIKGPDLVALARLRAEAVRQGADDAVLWGADGDIRETAHSALLWWRGDTLCHPGADTLTLPSITAQRVLAAARAAGIAVTEDRLALAAAAEVELWTVNALHGIRPVVSWQYPGEEPVLLPVDAARVRRFRCAVRTVADPTTPQECRANDPRR